MRNNLLHYRRSPRTTIASAVVLVSTLVLTALCVPTQLSSSSSLETIVLSDKCDSTMPVVSIASDAEEDTSYIGSFGAKGLGYHGLYFDEEGTYELTVHSPPHSALFSVKASCSTEDRAYIVRERTINNEQTERDIQILIGAWKFSSFTLEVRDKQKTPWNATFTVSRMNSTLTAACSKTPTNTVPNLSTYDTADGTRILCNISGSLSVRQGNWHNVKVGSSGTVTLDVCPNYVDIAQPLSVVAKVFTEPNFECPETPNAIVQFGAFENASCKVSWAANSDTNYTVFVSSPDGLRSGVYTFKLYGDMQETAIVNDACEASDVSAGVVKSVARFSERTARNGTRWFGFRSTKSSRKYKLSAHCNTNDLGDGTGGVEIVVAYDCSGNTTFANTTSGSLELVSPSTYSGQPYKVAVEGCSGTLSFEIETGSMYITVVTVLVVIILVICAVLCVMGLWMLFVYISRKVQRRYGDGGSNSVDEVNAAFDDGDIELDVEEEEIDDSTDKDSLIINTDY